MFVNLYQQSGSSNLIGWKLEMGVASKFIQQDKGKEEYPGKDLIIALCI